MKKCYKYPFDILKVGQCFDAHDIKYQAQLCPSIEKQKQYGRYFVVRKISKQTYRIWRVKSRTIITKISNSYIDNEWQIDNGFVIPIKPFRVHKYPLEKLEVGESLIAENASRDAIHNYNRKERNPEGKRFKTLRTSNNQLIVWRVK